MGGNMGHPSFCRVFIQWGFTECGLFSGGSWGAVLISIFILIGGVQGGGGWGQVSHIMRQPGVHRKKVF